MVKIKLEVVQSELEAFLKALKEFKYVKELRVWAKAGSKALAFLSIKAQSSSYNEILKKGALYFDSVKMERGFDVHPIVTSNFKNIKSILDGLEEIGEVKVTKIGTINQPSRKNLLTGKQAEALQKALSFNYYSWPRKATLEEIASKSKMTRRTFQEHLRKAESKLLPELIKEYFLM